MLIAENQPPFDSPDYFYELKLDGIRCLAYLGGGRTELRNKRNKDVSSIYSELSEIYKQVNRRCILDGELVSIKDGKPDFYEVQRRSLMSNPFKIKLAAEKQPVCFIAYDVLYIGDKAIMDQPLVKRTAALDELIKETPLLAVSRRIEREGVALFDVAKEQGLEGTVAKRKDSLYFPGKRTKDWIKMKNQIDEDFIVCGYYRGDTNAVSVVFGRFSGDYIVYQGHVSLGVSKQDYMVMEQSERADTSVYRNLYRNFPAFSDVKWLKPHLVCCVRYMERTKSGGLRQPVFKGLRIDKNPSECVI
jgi:bifunctional non-homologous end joining protein LigD/DNA ligase-1